MSKSNNKQNQTDEEFRCDQKQLELLKKCSEKGDMADWNKQREENPNEMIWLQNAPLERANLRGGHLEEADLWRAHLEGAILEVAHLEGADLRDSNLEEAYLTAAHLEATKLHGAHLEGARLDEAYLQGAHLRGAHLDSACVALCHLERADLSHAHLEAAHFTACVVDGLTLFWNCHVDRKTDFRGVGLDNCRIDEKTKYLLQYNRRRMNCEDWYKLHPRLAWPVKPFFWMSDYGNSTWRIIKTFFIMAICFAIVYYVWGALDYYLLDVTEHPGIVANLFKSEPARVASWLVPLRSIYFSIVTMTTLGFGDMYANANNYGLAAVCGHVLLGLHVLLGYVLLGALVTRFGVLFTSGLIPGEFKKEQEEQNRS
jgi:uncharacterized protein YjbI with pentapeptide repeats